MNPQQGGDPSVVDVITLNEPNVTYDQRFDWAQQMYTGKGDIQQVRRYKSIWGKNYTAYPKSWFDGNNSHLEFVNPYSEEVPIFGTDAGSNQPFMQEYETIKVYLTTAFKGGSGA